MGDIVLKQQILDRIKNDPVLSGEIAVELGVSALSMPRIIKINDKRLTQKGVLSIIKERTGYDKDNDLMEELQQAEQPEAQQNA